MSAADKGGSHAQREDGNPRQVQQRSGQRARHKSCRCLGASTSTVKTAIGCITTADATRGKASGHRWPLEGKWAAAMCCFLGHLASCVILQDLVTINHITQRQGQWHQNHMIRYGTIQYIAIQYDAIWYDTIRYGLCWPRQRQVFDTILIRCGCDTAQYNTLQYDYDYDYDVIRYGRAQNNNLRYNMIWYSTIRHYTM